MRQQYVIEIREKKELFIHEFAELDKDIMSLLCEETYKMEEIEAAIEKGKDALIDTIRTKNMYPIGLYADKIADSIIEFFEIPGETQKTLFFDDSDLLTKISKNPDPEEDIEEDGVDLDDILEDDLDDDFDETEEKIKGIKTSLKVESDILTLDEDA